MDVILDSNVYVSDYRMESISFKNLFDYLKRTGCSLILLRIVREEVVAHFRRDLKKRPKEAAEAWKTYRPLHFPERLPEFTQPDIKGQAKLMREKLMQPSEVVKITYYADTTRIPVDDIFIRGIHRIPPANGDGEELRDVIVWLSALDYAKTNKREVAFISDDSGFWASDGVRPEIQQDIKDRDVRVQLYRTIDRFVEENSPLAKPADEKWAYDIFPEFHNDVLAAAERAIRLRRFYGNATSLSLKAVHFKEGKPYELASEVQVAELLFTLDIQFETRTVSNMVPLAALRGPLELSGFTSQQLWMNWSKPSISLAQSVGVSGITNPGLFGWLEPLGTGQVVHPRVIEAQYMLVGTIRASARLVKGQISEKEVTELQIERIDQIETKSTEPDKK